MRFPAAPERRLLPELSRYYGIVVKMYYNDHAPPHFHAEYGQGEVVVEIDSLGVIAGALSRRAIGLVMEWAALHQGELRDRWNDARNHDPLDPIDPLP